VTIVAKNYNKLQQICSNYEQTYIGISQSIN